MRSAIISDIHGNLAALRAALDDVRTCDCGRVMCLGDLVDGGPSDLEVVQEIMRLEARCVRGNHDEVARLPKDSPELAYLTTLPPTIVEADIVFTHVTPRRQERRIRDRFEAWSAFDETTQRIAFIGHTHIPLIFSHRGGSTGAAKPESFTYNRPTRLDPADRYIICVGSVGHGRDGVAAPRYAIHDTDRGTIEIRRVEAPTLDP
jgi:predicted phosphodiesterase